MDIYARVKPQNPRVGQVVMNVHFQGTLYRGGARPTWYKIPPGNAAAMRSTLQETGAGMFDVVTSEEKVAVERAEEQARLQRLGLAAETVSAAPGTTIDLTKKAPPAPAVAVSPAPAAEQLATNRRGGKRAERATRAAAVPERLGDDGAERESVGHDLSTTDLRQTRG